VARRPGQKRSSKSIRRTTLIGRSALRLMSGISERQLLLWEQEELIEPVYLADAVAEEPLYDTSALRRARLIRTLAEDLEVNLPGIDVILNLLDQFDSRKTGTG
jgi:DNA-binding transcriptional MerR regulator